MKTTQIIFTTIIANLISFSVQAQITHASFKEDHVPNQLLVKFKESSDLSLASNFLLSKGSKMIKSFEDKSLGLYEFSKDVDLSKVAFQIQDLNEIEFVELNRYHYLQATPNDRFYSRQYGLNNSGRGSAAHDADIDAPEAWNITKGSRRVLIGVIDTGVDYRHPDLINNYWVNIGEHGTDSQGRNKRTNGIDDDGNGFVDDYKGWDFYSNDNDPTDGHGHGTHCAGIIAARGNNGTGVTGVNWEASIVGLKIFSDDGKTRTDAIVSAIDYASRLRIPITNNSWGSYTYSNAIRNAISRATSRGMLFVAAAGNYSSNSNDKPFYPASYKLSGVVSVAATDNKDRLASFSNYGSRTVDIAAPGERIYSTIHRNRYSYKNGTSMAAPFVSGVAGLLKAHKPSATAGQMKRAILRGGDSISNLQGVVETGKRVNAKKALDEI